MPSVQQNLRSWDQTYAWPEEGEEWSRVWGGSEAQWFFVIHPRIHRFLPAGTVLEVAPGHGRWTQYLKDYCRRLVGVDLSAACVEACRRRFAEVPDASFHVNDGYSLSMLSDGSVDFAFSFDSLVHAESDVLAAYLAELARTLAPAGVAFLHHSNLGAYRDPQTGEALPAPAKRHWRAASVSARGVAEECGRVGLRCISQEIVNWGGDHLTDCFSTLTRPGSPWQRDNLVIENADFMKEARHVDKVSRPYVGGLSPEATGPGARHAGR
jgi:SAM-dependent methyltransferase